MFWQGHCRGESWAGSQARRLARWTFEHDRVQRAGRQTANTHARKGMSGRHPDRFQVANLESSKRCSRMPLVGLVRLRWALEGATPSFDPIPPARRRQRLGDTETAPGRKWPDDLLPGESRCKTGSGDVPQGRNLYRTRRLMSVQ